jgi:hypothetical protein
MKNITGFLFCFLSAEVFGQVSVTFLGRFVTGVYAESATEVNAYDPGSGRLFSTNNYWKALDILEISNPASPVLIKQTPINPIGSVGYIGGVHGVTTYNGVVAVAVEEYISSDPGYVVFYDVAGNYLNHVTVGALPNWVEFTHDGNYVLCANEGVPRDDYLVDPYGSVSIIDVSGGIGSITQSDVTTLDFASVNITDPSVNIYGNNGLATQAEDLEPDYIAIAPNSKKAWVTLQENNALAIIDVVNKNVIAVVGLGYKDYSLPQNTIDVSDHDGIDIRNWHNVYGMFQPDAIKAVDIDGATYLVSANEGASRSQGSYEEEVRVNEIILDPTVFPDATTLQQDENLGRLKVTTSLGDFDNDGDYDALYTFGGRSFSIWDSTGTLIYDSGGEFESRIANSPFAPNFNSDSYYNTFDSRSDNKGPEPEAIEIVQRGGKTYAIIGFERISGFMIYDISSPASPQFILYENNRNFSVPVDSSAANDVGLEHISFISDSASPTGTDMLVISNEVSGTIGIYQLNGLSTGIEKSIIVQNSFQVWPNPSQTDYVHTSASDVYHLYNAIGQIIKVTAKTDQVFVGDLRPGIYFIAGAVSGVSKLIIQ